MWKKEIEFPDHSLMLWEIAEILKSCLDYDELKEFSEELLGWPSRGGEILEPCDDEIFV